MVGLAALIEASFDEHASVMNALKHQGPQIEQAVACWHSAVVAGRKIMLCGNGGSAADAQHIAAELVGRFKCNRSALPALALTTDTSALTAIGNDFGFDQIFARQVEALSLPGDLLVTISTSGNSANLVLAARAARAKGCYTLAFLGGDGGRLANEVDSSIVVPSKNTARIQEMHIFIGHVLCELLERQLTEGGLL